MGFSNMMIQAAKSIPKSTMAQSIPSLTYSSCSTTNMWWLKNCCNFSLTKLMEICSNPLYSKISKPAISSTAQKFAFFMEESMSVSLHISMSHLKRRSNTGLALGHPFGTNLDAGFAESLDHLYSVNTPQGSNLPWNVSLLCTLILSLIITSLGGVHNFSAGHHTGSNLKAVPGVFFTKSKDIKGIKSVFTLFIVINGGDSGLALGDEGVIVSIGGAETLGLHLRVEGLEELVEDMVGSLNFLLLSDTGLLQEIGHNIATSQLTGSIEVDTDELTETGGVVVPRGLGITIRLQNGVGSHNLVLKRNLLLRFLGAGGNNGQVGDDLLGVLSLAGTRLAGDQHGLILGVLHHATVGAFSNGPQMGWDLITPLSKIDLGAPEGVERITLVGVDDNHEKTRVSMDQLALVASLQIPEDRSIIEEGQVDHVLALLELGRVDLANLSSLKSELFVTNRDDTFASWILKIGIILEDTLAISMSLGVGDPDGLLGVVRLLLVGPLDLEARNQKLGGIWLLGSLLQLNMAGHGAIPSCGTLWSKSHCKRVAGLPC